MRCKYAFEPLVNLFWYYTGCFSLNYFCTNGCKANASLYVYFLLSCGVISRLRNIDNGADQSKYSSLIDCMCRWGQVGHIMELVCDWLSDTLTRRKVCICMCQRIKELLDYIKASCFFFFNRSLFKALLFCFEISYNNTKRCTVFMLSSRLEY